MVGIILFPLQIWVFTLLVRICISKEPLTITGKWYTLMAAAINVPYMFVMIRWLISS